MKVALSFSESNWRQRQLCEAWRDGARAFGGKPVPGISWHTADVLILWGMPPRHVALAQAWRKARKPVLVMDYGYWNRARKACVDGLWKLSLNGIHPPGLPEESHGHERWRATGGPKINPWRNGGDYVLLAGMGQKGSKLYGLRHGAWDSESAKTLRQAGCGRILYRPKPSDRLPPHIAGVETDKTGRPIAELIERAQAVVTHHGNAAVEALAAGVPVFCADGPGLLLGKSNLAEIGNPAMPDGRERFFWNLAHWQWTAEEIAAGAPLVSYKERGLI